MATSISNAILDTPEAKIITISAPENDAIRTQTVHTFGGANMMNLNAVPQEYYLVDTTNAAVNATVTCSLAISAISATGFTTVATSVAGAAVARTFNLYIHTRRFYQ